MPAPARGEVWLVDLGLAAKVRPALVLSVPAGEADRALVTLVPHTTSLRSSRFEVAIPVPFLRPGGLVDCHLGRWPRSSHVLAPGSACLCRDPSPRPNIAMSPTGGAGVEGPGEIGFNLRRPRVMARACAGHGTELVRGKSSHQVFAEPKGRRRARASPRGGVGRKPTPTMRGRACPELVEGNRNRRRGVGPPGTSWHGTATSAIRSGVCCINPTSTHREVCVVPRESCTASRRDGGGRAASCPRCRRQQRAE
jgi:hypothetical protein